MTTADIRTIVRNYWRVPLAGLLAAMVAFGGSYLMSTQYASATRLLIRGRDATFLTNTGQDLSKQPGVVDSSLATALSDTQSALLDSRTVASMVVADLHLDRPKPVPSGPLHKIKDLINKVKSYAVHGMYVVPDPHNAAVDTVFGGLDAKQLKTSYVIELDASAADPTLAQAIANSAANALVTVSRRRFQDEAAAYRDFLKAQLDQASANQDAASKAITDFERAHNIVSSSSDPTLAASSQASLRQQLTSADADLAAARARLTSLQSSLASIQATDSNVTNVTTGRSSTAISSTGPDAAYQNLLEATKEGQANIAALSARRDSIATALSPVAAGSGSDAKVVGLDALNARLSNATDQYKTLSGEYSTAVVNANSATVDVTRLDQANLPSYPFRPVRVLYLMLGLFFGAIVGFFLSYFKVNKHRRPLLDPDGHMVVRRPGQGLIPQPAGPASMAVPHAVSYILTADAGFADPSAGDSSFALGEPVQRWEEPHPGAEEPAAAVGSGYVPVHSARAARIRPRAASMGEATAHAQPAPAASWPVAPPAAGGDQPNGYRIMTIAGFGEDAGAAIWQLWEPAPMPAVPTDV